MIHKKRYLIIIILVLIAIASLIIILLDWLPFIVDTISLYETRHSNRFKAIVVLLATSIVFITGNNSLNKKDLIMMKTIYILIILADTALVLIQNPIVGILFFSLVQLGLIIRNSVGLKDKIRFAKEYPIKSSLFINTILSTVLFLLFLVKLINEHLDDRLLLTVIIFYGLMLSTSLWTALANYLLSLFPKINSILVSLGMFFFVLCDINVGLSLTLPHGLVQTISSNLVWIFYSPALTLIALSGYNLKSLRIK
ncbi:MAG: hypothetical protein PHY91_05575 [Tissierellia bacterium]|nr:hypothetical protein [Tissierellia bacterium]MDD4725986.1 hypothetical protein [Tissierellia bacterium]